MNLSLLLVAFSFSITSCKKDIESQSTDQISIVTGINFSTAHPTLNRGMLKFQSREHLLSYYNDLSEYLFVTMHDYDTDSLLAILETQLGHNSLRPVLNPGYDTDDRSDEDDFLKDEVRMTLLNEDYEIQIDDEIAVYQAENIVYFVDENNQEDLDYIQSLDKGDDTSISRDILTREITVESKKHIVVKQPKPVSVNNCLLTMDGFALTPAQCIPGASYLSASAYESITSPQGNTNGGYTEANWVVNWGDNQVDEFSGYGPDNLIHQYSNFGTYTVSVEVSIPDACTQQGLTTLSKSHSEEITVGENNCVAPNVDEFLYDDNNGSNWRLKAELWAKWDIFGNHQVAKTTGQKWANGIYGWQWYNHSGPIFAALYYDFRDSDDCGNSLDSGLETDYSPSKKTIRAGQSRGWTSKDRIPDEQVHSYHHVSPNDNFREGSLVLNVCD